MNNRIPKPSTNLAVIAWACVILESWMLVLDAIPVDFKNSFFWVFFLIVALFASSVASAPNPGRKL